MDEFSRTERLLGKEGMKRLAESRVAVFGVGGVGSYVAEALGRSGVGTLDLIDHDRVSITNLNRQIMALHSTVGRIKVEVMKERLLDINPEAVVNTYDCFYDTSNQDAFPFEQYDYIVDAVDTVTAKLLLIEHAHRFGVPVISCMGVGNKLNPQLLEITDINKTSVCPLARVMRRELKARGIKKCKVLYSKEPPAALNPVEYSEITGRHPVPGSVAFVPSVAGLIIAGEVIREISGAAVGPWRG